MSGEINYKMKYNELKARFMESVDAAYRLGFEDGGKQGQLDNANQQLQMAQDHAQNMAQAAGGAMGGQPGQPGMPGGGAPGEDMDTNNNGAPGVPEAGGGPDKAGAPSVQPGNPAAAMDGADAGGSELDQHIKTLESMVNKSELSPDDLKKAIDDLKSFQTNMNYQRELRKSAQAIPEIAKALHKPSFKIGVQASKNMSQNAKTAVSLQHRIVEDVMQKWESEQSKAGKDILSILNIEGLTKKEE